MSPGIAFDIAGVAQKVKVQLIFKNAKMQKCKEQKGKCKMANAKIQKCKMQNAKYKMLRCKNEKKPNSKCKMHNVYLQNAKCKIQMAFCKSTETYAEAQEHMPNLLQRT